MVKKHTTLEDLAIMVKHGFDEVHERLDQTATKTELLAVKTEILIVKKDLTQKMEEGFFAVNRRLDLLHEDISDLPAIREELKDHDERLVHVERKVGSRK
jgi:hypothetical protein